MAHPPMLGWRRKMLQPRGEKACEDMVRPEDLVQHVKDTEGYYDK